MARTNDHPDDSPNVGSMPFIETLQALEGSPMPEDQDAVVDPDEIESARQPTLTELDRLEADVVAEDADLDSSDALAAAEMRDGETDDPDVAAEEGLAWVPPIDPPVVSSPWEADPVVASGTGISALDEEDRQVGALDEDESEITARIREALRADSATSRLADTLVIAVVGSTAYIRGVVDDLDDGDAIVEVAQRVDGIEDVVDETEVAGL
jgi:BON domain-containing protein